MSVKLSGREEGSEGLRRRPGYGDSSYGGSAKLSGSVVTVGSSGRLKGGSSIPSSSNGSRQHNEELHLERISGTGKVTEEGLLPQWGRGKRSRCSRPEPSNKHSSSPPLQESVPPSKSAPPSLKKPLPNGVSSSKLRSHGPSKLPASSKLSAPERPVSRNGLINKTVNGSIHAIGFDSVRQVAEAKEAPLLSHQKRSVDYSSCRQQQRSEGSDFATTNTGHGHCSDNAALINVRNGTSGVVVSLSEANALDCNKPKVEWPRIAIVLTRKEKEEDFLVLKGSKLPQRPKKRLKVVEKALLFCTPGNWLSDLSRGRYDVREKKSTKKKPRGLKAMDSAESDSE